MTRYAWILSIFVLSSCGKKGPSSATPLVGWHGEEEWAGQCYHPPDFTVLGAGSKRIAWQDARNEVMSQWRGERNDGVKMRDKVIEDTETALFSKPERVEPVVAENLEKCMAAMKSGSNSEWEAWLTALPGVLTEGECRYRPMDYTLFDYLNIGAEWHIPVSLCKDNKILIKASSNDYYQIEDDGPFMNAEGDSSRPAGGDLPCNTETCNVGQLVFKFVGDSGVETIGPVGVEKYFTAPEHGKLYVRINDTTFFDNKWKVQGTIEHHTSITYEAQGL